MKYSKKHNISRVNISPIDALAKLRRRGYKDLAQMLISKQKNIKAFEEKIQFDDSKTEIAAQLTARKQASLLFDSMTQPFTFEKSKLSSRIDEFHQKVQPHQEIKGTTDTLILQNYLPLFEKKSDIFHLAKVDIDAARSALLLPVIRHKFKLDETDLTRLNDSLLKHVIGEDSYEELISLQDDHSELTSAMQLIAQEYRHNAEQIQKLESGIVENEIPEAEVPLAVAEMNAAIAAQQG
jgi:hypothetical protein